MCCDLMSIVQVAFVNPLINELCMYVWFQNYMKFSCCFLHIRLFITQNNYLKCSVVIFSLTIHSAIIKRYQ